MTETLMIGTLRAVDGKGVVRVEDVYATDIADLWSAVTDPERLGRWIADVDGDLRLDGTFDVRFTSGFEAPGRVDACEPPYRLLVTFNAGLDEETVIEAVLAAEAEGTRLTIEERGLLVEDLPGHGAGWQAHLEDLAAHLDGREKGDWRDRWAELVPAYRERGVHVKAG